ncbi:MAG: hypothetical protein WCQ52_01040 [Actinomycetes bacterium]|jgi:hypothetical protein
MSNSVEAKLGRGALIPSSVIGIIALIFFSIIRGKSGFYGALLAQVLVVIFFVVHLLVSRYSVNLEPIAVMALALLSYFVKIVFLGGLFFFVFANISEATLDRTSFGVASICVTFAWLGGEIRAFFKLRPQLPLPKNSESPESSN